ncbi:replication initiation factor domain-containing protein [Pectobacterium versatile]|uniref:replication initiation factor domain-containing protein n=1 Tax=Pectobacterium versatile TaxID=2488639 RepID=UPI001CF57798|nr:replication initiation factor domain-containing protein [Pectobacterium versatile]MCA6917542.1 replication initiation factor domain-containing protein [Pectobacterium versatile]
MQTIIDTIAFSAPISSLKYMDGYFFGEVCPWSEFPKMPESGDLHLFQLQKIEALEQRLVGVVNKFLGLNLSPATGRGYQGYLEHHSIFDAGGQQNCGVLAHGGNGETFYLYLNGHGCKLFFENRTAGELHKFLSEVLQVYRLNRLDLAYDDFSGATNVQSAVDAYDAGAFYGGVGMPPQIQIITTRRNQKSLGETCYVGSRTSQVYWRTYDKNSEQKIANPATPWVRHEAELKKISTDLLLDIDAAFAGCNKFAAALVATEPAVVRSPVEKTAVALESKIAWARRAVGKTLRSLIDAFDAPTALALLTAGEGGKLHLTPGEISVYREALQI